MKDRKSFGARLRELRTEAGFTLSKLAEKCNIDFTYLSKIESSALPPPSEKVILHLAAALNADKDELLILAGKIPADITEILKSREALELLRSGRLQKTGGKTSPSFGQKLRELRRQLGLTLKELEARVNVNYTYLSKIENGVLPPPSEKVIVQLAEALNADKEELLLLAGVLPPDIVRKLKDPNFLKTLRSRIDKTTKRKAEKQGFKLLGIPVPNIGAPVSALTCKPLYRVALPIILVMAIATSLWFASPTQALEISFSTPASGLLGSAYTFTSTVTINQNDIIPIQNINIEIYNVGDPTKKATLENLPLTNSALQPHTIKEGVSSGTATVSASVTPGWISGYGYGYGYASWINQGYNFGYGYGYGYGGGITSITYTVHWTSPSNWPAGTYRIDTKVTASGPLLTETFTGSDTFTLTAYTPGPGPGPSPTTTPPTTTPPTTTPPTTTPPTTTPPTTTPPTTPPTTTPPTTTPPTTTPPTTTPPTTTPPTTTPPTTTPPTTPPTTTPPAEEGAVNWWLIIGIIIAVIIIGGITTIMIIRHRHT